MAEYWVDNLTISQLEEMANELRTVSQERASLQQRVEDISKQLDEVRDHWKISQVLQLIS